MSDAYEFKTETQDDLSCGKTNQIKCIQWWEMLQQWSYTRLSWKDQSGKKATLISTGVKRAKVIAGIYARFYLETERFGDPKLKGRYYWMGLGAFASRTVHYGLDDWRMTFTPSAANVLSIGNFWLFMDIAPWHFAYSQCAGSFQQCAKERDARKFTQRQVRAAMAVLPQSKESLAKIGHLTVSPFIKKGFELVADIENAKNKLARREVQLEQVIEIAKHEQGVVLQPLCWDHPALKRAMAMSRGYDIEIDSLQYNPDGEAAYATAELMRQASPTLQLVFSHKKDSAVKDPKLKSVAPKYVTLDGKPKTLFKVENYAHRMDWITKAAEKYHGLMDTHIDYMETELQAMSVWYTKEANLSPKIL